MHRSSVFAAAALALAVSPLAVQASPADRSGAEIEAESLWGTTLWIVAAIALGLIIWGVLEILDNDTNAVPLSP